MMDAMKAHKALHNTEKTLLLPAKASATSWGRVAAAAVALACVSGLGVAARVARSQESLAVSTEAAATTGASSGVDGRDAAWAKFKGDFAKEYETEVHEARARNNFEARLEKLAAANAANGGVEVFGVTEHADREPGARAYARGRRARVPKSERPASPSRVDLEPVEGASHAFVDWRADSRGVVSAVKNQGQCGSCWAFSATEQVESQLVLAGAPQVELSTQQVASCTADPQLMCCDGCAGGDPTAAYEYLAWASHKGGLAPDAWWPYEQGLTPDEVCEAPACTKTCDKDVSQLPADFGYVGPYAKVSGYAYAIPECDVGACDDQDTDQLAARLEASPLSVPQRGRLGRLHGRRVVGGGVRRPRRGRRRPLRPARRLQQNGAGEQLLDRAQLLVHELGRGRLHLPVHGRQRVRRRERGDARRRRRGRRRLGARQQLLRRGLCEFSGRPDCQATVR